MLRGDPYFGDYYIDEERFRQLSACAIKPGDLLISLVGTVGRTLILPDDAAPGIINPRLIKISVDEALVIPEFLQVFFASPSTRMALGRVAHGGTMDVINMATLKAIAYPVPPLAEQQRIAAAVRQVESVIDHLETDIRVQQHKLRGLRQSILNRAFEGRLVDQDPSDEPASVLLERIRAERESAGAVKRATRRSKRREQDVSAAG